MGGKRQVANRTKNNARPSSSGRSAELLSTNLPGFGVFSGASTTTSLTTSLPTFVFNVEELDSSIDVNFQLVLKKISKKDSTTKSKGLQEFKDLVKKSDPEVVKAILPTWTRFYNVLSTDSDNRVREETHNVHHEIVLKVKRNLAPYLKQLMPPWFTSQYDTYPPAASAATLAFQDAFPVYKSQDVVVFCQSEILGYIHDNLLVQTAQTLSHKNASPDDAESKHIQVLTSCLQGYCLYVDKVAPDKIQEALDANQRIITNAKFWKFAKHSIPSIRSAFFKVIKTICQKAMFLLNGKENQLLTTIFNNLEEEDPTVLPHVWECVLLAVSEIEEWWKFINVEKIFIPKLMNVLKKAGQGNATVMYPNILPLISHLPPLKDDMQFYTNFFTSFTIGLKLKSVISSRSESNAVASAFVECLQYVIIKNSINSELCKNLIEKNLLPIIEWCLTNKDSNHKTVFKQTAGFVQYLSRNNQTENFNLLLKDFLAGIEKLFCKILRNTDNNQEDILSIADKQITFVLFLKQNNHNTKKISKVKFSTEEDSQLSTKKPKKNSKENDDISYKDILENLVINICVQYCTLIEEKQNKELIEKLCSLIMDFNSKNLFDRLLEKDKKSESTTLISIYETLLRNWLVSTNLGCKSVVRLVFLLFSHLEDADKTALLKDLLKLDQSDCLQWSISEALAYPYREDPLVKLWLKSREISDFFIATTEKIIKNECPSDLKILYKLALTENTQGDLPIDNQALKEIVAKISDALSQEIPNDLSQDPCISLASYLSNIIYTEHLLLTYGTELLLTLFDQACKISKEIENMSSETIFELNTAWQDSIAVLFSCLDKENIVDITKCFAEIVEKHFLAVNNFEIDQIHHFAKVITNFLKAAFKSIPLMVQQLKTIMFKRDKIESKKEDILLLFKLGKYMSGNLSEELIIAPNITELEVIQYFVWSYVKITVLNANFNDDNDYDDEASNEEEDNSELVAWCVIDDTEEEMIGLIEDYISGTGILMFYNNIKYYEDLMQYNTLTLDKIHEAIMDTSIKKLTSDDRIAIKKVIQSLENFQIPLEKTFSSLKLISLDKSLDSFEPDNRDSILVCFEKAMAIRNENVALFLLEDTSLGSWKDIEKVIDAIKNCSAVMDSKNVEFFRSFDRKYWDFVVLSLVSWSNYCYKFRASLDKYQYQKTLVAVTNLFHNVSETIEKRLLGKAYVDEWEDILCEGIHNHLAHVWLFIADELSSKTQTESRLIYLPFIHNFGLITDCMRHDIIFKVNENFPKWTKFLKRSCSLLSSPLPSLQIWGYKMLMALIPGFIKFDLEAVNTNKRHQKGLIFEQFKGILFEFQEVVDSIVSEFRLGEESCRIEPCTDAFTYTLAYLLLWDVLLSLCKHSPAELKYQYADWLKSGPLLKTFLSIILCLMPNAVLRCVRIKSDNTALNDYFIHSPLDGSSVFSRQLDADVIEQFACYLYMKTLTHLPALVRQWWADLDSRVSQIVEKITSQYVSRFLCLAELNNLVEHQDQYKNMTIQIMPSVWEILAVYTVDEAQMELTITLPSNYPLGSPQVECNRPIVGTQCGSWLLQFKKCVFHQNGKLSDGLSLWYNNLDRKFDGVEECYICFAVLHTGTYQLPRLTCQTCKKKFHSACLYKWFSTSNKSSCPICRNLF